MQKLLCATIALLCAAVLQAQEEEKDVTKFLGIPVDGYKPSMIEKLKAKGFTPSTWDKDVLEGEFNGTEVQVHIRTNNNKVYSIILADKYSLDETTIKSRFNRLCEQFENNPKYTAKADKKQTIPAEEDISYEIAVKNKCYAALFYQFSQQDTIAIYNKSKQSLLSKYTQEQLDNPTKEISTEIQIEYILNKYNYQIQCLNKSVGFMIAEFDGKYRIYMFYDNKYNEADGEDL